MKKIFMLMLSVFLLFAITCAASAVGQDESNDLSLEVLYNFPYNSNYANGSFSLGLVYPFWGIFRLSGDAEVSLFKNPSNNNPPGLVAGVGINIPLGGFNLIADWKKGFELSSGGVNDYCNICDLGIDLKLSERYTFRSYVRELNNFGSQYTVQNGKISYLGFGFDYKL